MKIAILSAMQEELTPILATLKNYTKEEYAKNTFYFANYCGKELVLAYSKIGKVNAALTATLLIEKFGCQKLLFTGVAGAIKKELKIKDLIYASSLVQHDLDITAFGHPLGFVPGGAVFVKSSNELNKIAKNVAKDLDIKLDSGIVATGDQFICNKDHKEKLSKMFGASAVEMEGASVAVVCDALKIPFFVLRSISDSSGDNAHIDFDEFLEESARVSAKFILNMVEHL